MALKVADAMWEMLEKAGVKRCYGIVGDALNPVIDALRRTGFVTGNMASSLPADRP
jgi:pyruvate dehydrogenase (quinone)